MQIRVSGVQQRTESIQDRITKDINILLINKKKYF